MLPAMPRAIEGQGSHPSLGRSAGARFTATRPLTGSPRERRAARTLSRDSLTVVGKPDDGDGKKPAGNLPPPPPPAGPPSPSG